MEALPRRFGGGFAVKRGARHAQGARVAPGRRDGASSAFNANNLRNPVLRGSQPEDADAAIEVQQPRGPCFARLLGDPGAHIADEGVRDWRIHLEEAVQGHQDGADGAFLGQPAIQLATPSTRVWRKVTQSPSRKRFSARNRAQASSMASSASGHDGMSTTVRLSSPR